MHDNVSPTFQAEIADRRGHERGEEAPGGEMSHQKPHNNLTIACCLGPSAEGRGD